jgi:hypothetical protein
MQKAGKKCQGARRLALVADQPGDAPPPRLPNNPMNAVTFPTRFIPEGNAPLPEGRGFTRKSAQKLRFFYGFSRLSGILAARLIFLTY